MHRNATMVIKLPKEAIKDFRLFIVTHGGEIVEERELESEGSENIDTERAVD